MAPVLIEIELTAVDNQNANNFGLAYLPQAPMQIKANQALANFSFLLVSSVDHVSPVAGLTVTATRSINGGAFGACTNAPSSLASGIYTINLSASDMNGAVITFLFTAAGADARYVTIVTQS